MFHSLRSNLELHLEIPRLETRANGYPLIARQCYHGIFANEPSEDTVKSIRSTRHALTTDMKN